MNIKDFISERLNTKGRISDKTLDEQIIIAIRREYNEAGIKAVEQIIGQQENSASEKLACKLRKDHFHCFNSAGRKAAQKYLEDHGITDKFIIVEYFQKARFGKRWKRRYKEMKTMKEAAKRLPKLGRPKK